MPPTIGRRRLTAAAVALGVVVQTVAIGAGAATPSGLAAAPTPTALVRINLVGYPSQGVKRAYVMAPVAENGARFDVVGSRGSVLSGGLGKSLGSWNPAFPYVYAVDFDTVTTAGTYTITVAGPAPASSPAVRVANGSTLYSPLAGNAVQFYVAQRDGPGTIASVLNRMPSHLNDAHAAVYATPAYLHDTLQRDLQALGRTVDASGGWFDAGDYIKFVETASYTDAVMLLGSRDRQSLLGVGAPADTTAEARFGLAWLQKMWNDATATLNIQVGIGDGNGCGTICGDHDIWRLPQADDGWGGTTSQYRYIRNRPVFAAGAPGAPISPNLAGRLTADFALCYQLLRGSDSATAAACLRAAEHVFGLAAGSWTGPLVTAEPHDYYPETEWRDDMELGATELALALAQAPPPPGLPQNDPAYYLRLAAGWAHAYLTGPGAGADTLNLYDVSGLAHQDLLRAMIAVPSPTLAVTRAQLLADLKRQVMTGAVRAASDPFGAAVAFGGDFVPHELGLAVEAQAYDAAAGTTEFAAFAQRQLDVVLGANAWGTSFIVGAGPTFPFCMQHMVANLSGSLNGSAPLVLGATVDGPSLSANFTGLGVPAGARPCPPGGGDRFAAYNGHGARYVDAVAAWPSVEPSDDYTAITLLAFADAAMRP